MLLSATTEPVAPQAHPFIIVINLPYYYDFGAVPVVDLTPGAPGGSVLARHEDGDLIEATWQEARTPLSPVSDDVTINVGPKHVAIIAN